MSGLVVDDGERRAIGAVPKLDGVVVGSLLRVWDLDSDGPEDLPIGRRHFFDVLPWSQDCFAIHHQMSLPPEPVLTIHSFLEPRAEIARLYREGDSRQHEIKIDGDPAAWRLAPPLVPATFPEILSFMDGRASLHQLRCVPPSPDAGDGDSYRVTPIGDGRTVLLSHTRYGDELLLVDVHADSVVATRRIGMNPTDVLAFPARNEVWIAQEDQLLRVDLASMSIKSAIRLRADRSGSFIAELATDVGERRCAVSWALRSRSGVVGEPAGGRVIIVEVDDFEPTMAAEAPSWVDDIALLSDGRVCGRLSGYPGAAWIGTPRPAEIPVFPVRQPNDRNWL